MRDVVLAQRKFARSVEQALQHSVGTMEAGRRSDQDMLADMVARNDRNQARLNALLDRLNGLEGDAAQAKDDLDMAAGLHGARLELEVLRQRMHLSQEPVGQDGDAAAPTSDSAPQSQSKAG